MNLVQPEMYQTTDKKGVGNKDWKAPLPCPVKLHLWIIDDWEIAYHRMWNEFSHAVSADDDWGYFVSNTSHSCTARRLSLTYSFLISYNDIKGADFFALGGRFCLRGCSV